jgi:site-specific DNA-cytosine methylase
MKPLNILVGCEESQAVTSELLALGHNAYSCDLQECSGKHPDRHFQKDIFEVLFLIKWDIIILHPPCTKIAVSGNRWYGEGTDRHNERLDAVNWTQSLWDAATTLCDFVAMENPVGVLNKYGHFPKPSYTQPYQFGHGETKKTGFWLHGLPSLEPTNEVEGREQRIWKMPPSEDRGKLRSKTYKGIAEAMAKQWTSFARLKMSGFKVKA